MEAYQPIRFDFPDEALSKWYGYLLITDEAGCVNMGIRELRICVFCGNIMSLSYNILTVNTCFLFSLLLYTLHSFQEWLIINVLPIYVN